MVGVELSAIRTRVAQRSCCAFTHSIHTRQGLDFVHAHKRNIVGSHLCFWLLISFTKSIIRFIVVESSAAYRLARLNSIGDGRAIYQYIPMQGMPPHMSEILPFRNPLADRSICSGPTNGGNIF